MIEVLFYITFITFNFMITEIVFSGVWRVENSDFTAVEMPVSSIPAEKSLVSSKCTEITIVYTHSSACMCVYIRLNSLDICKINL